MTERRLPRSELAAETPMALPKGLAYSTLTKEMQQQILLERMQRLEVEHYSHTLNLRIAQDHLEGNGETAALVKVAETNNALVMIEEAHSVLAAELADLG